MPDTLVRLQDALQDRYRLERELGRGGMATVYLAEDLKHHRKVALKLLEPELAATISAGRFAREIEVAARLQHPNILPLLDSGQAGELCFYVMPYVEGESLRDRLKRGPLPPAEVVRILLEVADALGYAHVHGVVHRDIKPDNVLLSGRHALVVDFGVAKALGGAAAQGVRTATGVALGTPAYMAPEQALAEAGQDHRVDIYALGVLGYELLTGRGPFVAGTPRELLAAQVIATPDPVETHRPEVSPELSRVVMRCLEKDPDARWQTAEEVRAQLEPLATPSGGSAAVSRPLLVLRRLPRWMPWAAGAVVVAGGVALLGPRLFESGRLTVTLSDIAQVTSDKGLESQPSISPDGKEVAYVATQGAFVDPRLVIRGTTNVAGGGEVRVTDTAFSRGEQVLPRWAPDGEFVRFGGCRSGADCGWYRMGRMGGTVEPLQIPRRMGRAGSQEWAWSPDGSRIAFVAMDTIYVAAPADTSARRVVVHTTNYQELHSLAWSPDGRWIAYVNGPSHVQFLAGGGGTLWIVSAEGGEPRAVTPDHGAWSPAWLDARHLLFISDRDGPSAAYVIEVGPEGGRGAPEAIAGVSDPKSLSYSIAARKLAWSRFAANLNLRSFPLGRARAVPLRDGRQVTSGNREIQSCDVSRDGRWVAFDDSRLGRSDLYTMAVEGGDATPLTHAPFTPWTPRWSPDGTEIAYFALTHGVGSSAIWVVPSRGGASAALTPDSENHSSPEWSPDGLRLVVNTWVASTRRAFVSVLSRDSVGGPWHAPRELAGVPCLGQTEWSPDGTALACYPGKPPLSLVSPQTGRVLRSLVGPTSLLQLTLQFRFSRDGRTVYATGQHRNGRWGIWAIPLAGGPARQVVAYGDPALWASAAWCVGTDRLLVPVAEPESDIWVANLRY